MRRLVLPLAACLLLAGCEPTVSLTPAPQATAVGCARVIVGLPQTVGQAERRNTDAQGTAAWGSPASVVLRCGVETPVASAATCFTYSGVNWLETTSGDDRVLTTFGRAPGVQVVTTPQTSVNSAIPALNDAVAAGTRSTGLKCLGSSTS